MLETHRRGDKAFEGRLHARVSKLSADVLAMMNSDTVASAKPQELYKPSDVVAPPQVSSPANARIKITGTSVPVDMAPQFLPNARAAHLPGEKGHWALHRRSVRYRVRPERGHA